MDTTALIGFHPIADSSGTFWTSSQVKGHLMGATDSLPTPLSLEAAVQDMQTAYIDAMGRWRHISSCSRTE